MKIHLSVRSRRAANRVRMLSVVMLSLMAPALLSAQDPAAGSFQAYSLRSTQAQEIEQQLIKLLSGLPAPPEIMADPRNNRLLVRGNEHAQELVRQLLATLDRPVQGQTPPVLKSYPTEAAELPAIARQLQAVYAGQPEVRIATDARTSQLLVLASPEVHAQIARQLEQPETPAAPQASPPARQQSQQSQQSQQPTPAQPPTVSPPGPTSSILTTGRPTSPPATPPPPAPSPPVAAARPAVPTASPPAAVAQVVDVSPARLATSRRVALSNFKWDQIEQALRELTAGRLTPVPSQSSGDLAAYRLSLAGASDVEIVVNRRTQQIDLRGQPALLERTVRLLNVLDMPQEAGDRRTRVVPVSTEKQNTVRRAVHVLTGGQGAAVAPSIAAPHNTAVVRTTPSAVSAPPQPAMRSNAIPLVARLFQNQAQPGSQPPANQPPPDQPGPAPDDVPPEGLLTSGLVGSVQIEFLEGLDIMIISGNQRDVERVSQIIADIERLTDETAPVVEVYHLQHVGSEQLATIVTQIYDQVLSLRQGAVSITALVKPNALLLIGREESVRMVTDLVARLDQPVGPASQFSVFRLQHASAADVATTLTTFYTERTGLGTRVLVTPEYRTNSVIVQASPRDLAEVAELIERIDTVSSGAVEELRVFPLQNSLADVLAPVLQDAINGQGAAARLPGAPVGPGGAQQPGAAGGKSTMLRFTTIDPQGQRELRSGILTDVRITADPNGNALIVSGPSESMDLIGALIRQLDQIPAAESQIKVFTVINGDAAAMRAMLETLFGQATQQGAGGGGIFGGAAGGFQQGGFLGENPLVGLRFSVDERTNSIIASGSAGDLNIVEAILLRLDESDVRQRQSIVYRLKNAPALAVANTINDFLRSERAVQELAPAQISPFQQMEREVVVVPEQVSNSLIVSATPRYFDEIRKIVEELDARPPMVMIQVLIAEVTLNNTDEFGVELGLQDSVLFDRSLLGEIFTLTESTQTPQGNTVVTTTNQVIQAATLTPGFNFNNQPLGNSGSQRSLATSGDLAGQGLTNFSVGRVNSELGFGGLVLSASSESISILIRALKECRRLDVLSRPQIMTLDNQPAFIQVGARVPRVQGVVQGQVGVAPVLTVIDTNVGLILGVTPRISPDGLVVMEIDAERSSLGPESEGVPITTTLTGEVVRSPLINTTTAQTTVSAADGQTVVLGGLLTKAKTSTRRRVPLLSSIPILGNLFRYDLEAMQRTELLIIMTPRVVRNEADADRIKQAEAARMSWCLADVKKLHGDPGIISRDGEWGDDQTIVIYPDQDPTLAEPIPAPPGAMIVPEGVVVPPGAVPPSVLMPPGAVAPEALPQGAIPPGAMPPGAMPPGALPPGAIPQGTVPPAVLTPAGPGGVPPGNGPSWPLDIRPQTPSPQPPPPPAPPNGAAPAEGPQLQPTPEQQSFYGPMPPRQSAYQVNQASAMVNQPQPAPIQAPRTQPANAQARNYPTTSPPYGPPGSSMMR